MIESNKNVSKIMKEGRKPKEKDGAGEEEQEREWEQS